MTGRWRLSKFCEQFRSRNPWDERDLADAILDADNRLIQNLTREDLESLLT